MLETILRDPMENIGWISSRRIATGGNGGVDKELDLSFDRFAYKSLSSVFNH